MDSVLSCVKTRLHRNRKACGSSSNRQKSQASYTLTILWNLQNSVKTYHGIIGRPHLIDPRPMEFPKEQHEEWWKEPQPCWLQSGLDQKWWADSMECYCYLRNVQDLLADGKTPYEWRFEEPVKGPVFPFGAVVEYHQISTRDQNRRHQYGKKVLPGIFLGYALIAVENLERRYSWLLIQKNWKHRKFSATSQCERSTDLTKGSRINFPICR